MSKKFNRRFKMKIYEHKMMKEDREILMKHHLHLAFLSKQAKRASKDTREFFKREIKELREIVRNEYCPKFWNVELSASNIKISPDEMFPYYPKRDELIQLKNDLFNKIRAARSERKRVSTVQREFNGFRYNVQDIPTTDTLTVTSSTEAPYKDWKIPSFKGARCFVNEGSILGLMSSSQYAQRIKVAKKPYDKSNFVGVELEFVAKVPQDILESLLVTAKLSGNVCCVGDGSLRPDPDHYGPGIRQYCHEVTIIAKQENIKGVIERVCAVLNSEQVAAYVNNTCGMHVHLDMRHRDPNVCYRNLYNALPVLAAMVPKNRTNGEEGGRYCALNEYSDFIVSGNRENRYRAINPEAYKKHKTLEVRLHSGTTNFNKISNWVSILTSIVDKKEMSLGRCFVANDLQLSFSLNDALVEYIKMRIKKFETDSYVTNKEDNFDIAI